MPWPGQRSDRRGVPTTLRDMVLDRDRGVCHECGHEDAEEVDHVVPVAEGGTDDPLNLAPIHGTPCTVCSEACHLRKTSIEAATARTRTYAKGRYPTRRHPAL